MTPARDEQQHPDGHPEITVVVLGLPAGASVGAYVVKVGDLIEVGLNRDHPEWWRESLASAIADGKLPALDLHRLTTVSRRQILKPGAQAQLEQQLAEAAGLIPPAEPESEKRATMRRSSDRQEQLEQDHDADVAEQLEQGEPRRQAGA